MQLKNQAKPLLARDGLQTPTHVAIIMDGNGRWAKRRGLPRLEGHRAGMNNISGIVQCLSEYGVKYATLYAFSTENWNRPLEEVAGLMALLEEAIHKETMALHEKDVRILHLGRTNRLSSRLRKAVADAQKLTRDNKAIALNVAFDYGGRAEILDAVKQILQDGIPPDQLDEAVFCRYLYTAGLPDPDLIIRTGSELRLSNFLLWQSAYSEYYTTSTLWPDLSDQDIAEAIEAYSHRKRRFGTLDSEDYTA